MRHSGERPTSHAPTGVDRRGALVRIATEEAFVIPEVAAAVRDVVHQPIAAGGRHLTFPIAMG